MRSFHALAVAAALSLAPVPSFAQRAADLPAIDVTAVVGDVGAGWVKKSSGDEGVTYVCDTAACGGRGVIGVGQAKATPEYVKAVIDEPDTTLKSYRYATDESMRPSGCAFKDYEVRRLSDRRIQYDSQGACQGGAAAAMSTIFDGDRPGMIAVQVLTNSESEAVRLRDANVRKLIAAMDQPGAPPAP